MSNYTPLTNFTAKDALATGDANKRTKGSEISAELTAIATAITSKEDSTNKNAINGYCGLDASALIPSARMPAFTGDVTSTAGTVALTIAAGIVTYAKIQNVSATNRILGRITAGAGVIEELSAANVSTILGLVAIATSGSASDLTAGTINTARVSGAYGGITGVGTLVSGSIPTSLITGLATVATSGSATDLGAGTLPDARLSSNVPLKNTVNSFTKGNQTTPSAVTFNATTMTLDASLSNVFTCTFTANVTVAPTVSNPGDGQTINWFITQDATGSRTMTWPTSFKWPSGTAGVLTTTANAVDLLVATYRAATGFWYSALTKDLK